jgi:hypothetical protein
MTMNKALLRTALVAGFLALAGEAVAVKSINSLTGPGGQGSAEKAVERQDVLKAVQEVCRVWNTDELRSVLDPDFSDSEAFIGAFGALPKDARLVLIELLDFRTTSKDVVASVRVAIEFKQGGATQRDTPRLVTWTFKRYD